MILTGDGHRRRAIRPQPVLNIMLCAQIDDLKGRCHRTDQVSRKDKKPLALPRVTASIADPHDKQYGLWRRWGPCSTGYRRTEDIHSDLIVQAASRYSQDWPSGKSPSLLLPEHNLPRKRFHAPGAVRWNAARFQPSAGRTPVPVPDRSAARLEPQFRPGLPLRSMPFYKAFRSSRRRRRHTAQKSAPPD